MQEDIRRLHLEMIRQFTIHQVWLIGMGMGLAADAQVQPCCLRKSSTSSTSHLHEAAGNEAWAHRQQAQPRPLRVQVEVTQAVETVIAQQQQLSGQLASLQQAVERLGQQQQRSGGQPLATLFD